MTLDELKRLMSAIATSDRRTTSKADVDFWAAMALEGRWTLGTAMRALVQFRAAHPGEWLEPGHLSAIIRDARRKAAASFVVPDLPEGIAGSDYPRWYRTQLAAHIGLVLDAWAVGQEIPEPAASLEANRHEKRALTTGPDLGTCPEELREQFARDMARAGRPRPAVVPHQLPRHPAADPDRRAAARAEIAALAPETGTDS